MTTSVWTDDRIDRLKMLWFRNLSASAVARELGSGITRNAVLSKVHRMGLSKTGRGRGASVAQAGDIGRTGPLEDGAGRLQAAPQPRSDVQDDAVPDTPTSSLLTVGRTDCRFPYGDPQDGPLALCGRAVARGVYCAAHGRIAYHRATPSAESLMALAGLG